MNWDSSFCQFHQDFSLSSLDSKEFKMQFLLARLDFLDFWIFTGWRASAN